MPLVGTSGSLSFNKSVIGDDYWILQWNVAINAGLNIDLTYVSNKGIYFGGSTTNAATLCLLTQSFGNIGISSQNTFSYPLVFNFPGIDRLYYTNNKIYAIANQGAGSDYSMLLGIYDYPTSLTSIYLDDGVISGASTSFPWFRAGHGLVVDNSNNTYVLGTVNEKPNSTTNNFQFFINKYNGATKVSSKILYNSLSGFLGNTGSLNWTNDNKLLCGMDNASWFGITKYDPVTETIDYQYKIDTPAGSSGLRGFYTKDSNDNVFVGLVVFGGGAAGSYIQKYNSSGTQIWSKKISTGTLYSLSCDNAGYVYALIGTAAGNGILKIDDTAATITWQRNLGISSNFNAESIDINGTSFYLRGSSRLTASTNSEAVIKLPNNGDIPGTGSYTLPSGYGITYAISTLLTLSNGSPNVTNTNSLTVQNAIATGYGIQTGYSQSSVITPNSDVLIG
jgi:hypothetical protein